MELMESGAATGARKSLDRGIAVAGFVTGTRRLFDFVDRNPAVNVRSTGYTHDSAILSAQHALAAINSAIEVDVFGAVNAEVAAGKYVGAVGGAMDFLRGAAASRGGLPIVALPSSARGRSRIVAALGGPVSTPRADAAIIVTENGIADLRGLSLERRVEEMLRLAAPVHRGELAVAAEPILRGEHQLTRGTVR
jgi:acyl-CoA hydrolase